MTNLEKLLAEPITEIVCAWCAKSKTTGEQLERGSERYNKASHGMCKSCSDVFVVPKTFKGVSK